MGLLKPIKAFTDFLRENQKEGMTVAEIGVYDGSTTSDYIDIIKNNKGHLYVVDWFNGNVDTGGTHGYNPNNHDSVIDLFKNNISSYLDITTILDGPSHDMIRKIPDGSLDICFIDADHRYSFVYEDIKLMIPKMKKDGIMIGHDYEDFDKIIIGKIKDEWLEIDYAHIPEIGRWAHCGVVQAVYDHFGYDVEYRLDPDGQGAPIWIKKL